MEFVAGEVGPWGGAVMEECVVCNVEFVVGKVWERGAMVRNGKQKD